MAQVLYRKYRPNSFSEIKGQEHIVSILIESILKDKVSHAYLFAGPRGSGKTTIARIMAKAINCQKFQLKKDVCNECDYCMYINQGNSMDIIEMDAASNRGIEEIRTLKETLNFMPSFLKKKVYIIDEAHMLTKEAFNALLKSLEEPPEHVVFILATTESSKLPITILSRVTRFDFKFGEESEIIDKLNYIVVKEGISIQNDALQIIYQYSGGSFRDAESLLGKVLISFNKDSITVQDVSKSIGIISNKEIEELLNIILKGDNILLIDLINKIFSSDTNTQLIIDQLISHLKDKILNNIKDGIPADTLLNVASMMIKSKGDLKEFPDKKLILQIELLKIAQNFGNNNQHSSYSKLTINESINNIDENISLKSALLNNETGKQNTDVSSKENLSLNSIQENLNESISTINFKEKLVLYCIKSLPRLAAILKSSEIYLDGNNILISNTHKFNLTYLSKKEVKDLILEFANKLFNIKFNLVLKLSDAQDKNEYNDKSETIIRPENLDLENNKEISKKDLEEKSKDDKMDNTLLIESIL